MSLLLPITTIILVLLGSACLFMAIEHDRRVSAQFSKKKASTVRAYGSGPVEGLRRLFLKVRNAE
ncbi:Uncharacterised protein [Chlamydia abortus]|uniref:Uncharacterized protein n=1 Tax=Paenibacillus residui TaxID=629724 RepID=A0ABW3D672_9BACL|nr:hypothetical protein [Paenibacillus sp. 32O-W]SHE10568.1 Uncharacterised protein [Chlamydia abortus]